MIEYIFYLLRGLTRKLPWIMLGTILVTAMMYKKTKGMRGAYTVESTMYTGVVSGYSIEENNSVTNWAMAQNAIDNLINIIQSESTLRRVSIRLFSTVLVKGNPNEDTDNITAACYKATYDHLKNSPDGKTLVSLIDRKSVDKTIENFLAYEKQDRSNYIYGLFYFQHPYYSIQAIRNIQVTRLGSSDLLKLRYSSGDPCIAYNTIHIMEEEFVREYQNLRYGETDKVIAYFRGELDRIGDKLSQAENDLTSYNVENKIINYSDETKEVAAINKEYDLREQEILLKYKSAKASVDELERQMQMNERQALNSIDMLSKLKEVSTLNSKISELETVSNGSKEQMQQLSNYRKELENLRHDLSGIMQKYTGDKYSKSGIARNNIIEQWLDQTLIYEQSKAQLEIVEKDKKALDDKYVRYAPVGTTIKQKERLINFTEQNYLSNLKSYNDALLRKKNLEMTSASIKVLNPAAYPINTEKTKRKILVLGAFVGSFFVFTAIFLVIALIDRTLRDSLRTKSITKCDVIGVFPRRQKDSVYDQTFQEMALRNLSSTILPFFHADKGIRRYKLNLLSFDPYSNKKSIALGLKAYWEKMGLPVRIIDEGVDFFAQTRSYLTAEKLEEIYTPGDEKILIVIHQDASRVGVTTPLLTDADLNLLVVSADYGWKRYDATLLETLEEQLRDKPYICLTDAPDYDLEKYVGMLPPNTGFRKIRYRISQLSISEIFRHKKDYFKERKASASTLGDDDDV